MSNSHEHRAIFSRGPFPFNSSVASGDRVNTMAHGGVTWTDLCRCGSERKTNVNGRHREIGPWQHETQA